MPTAQPYSRKGSHMLCVRHAHAHILCACARVFCLCVALLSERATSQACDHPTVCNLSMQPVCARRWLERCSTSSRSERDCRQTRCAQILLCTRVYLQCPAGTPTHAVLPQLPSHCADVVRRSLPHLAALFTYFSSCARFSSCALFLFCARHLLRRS